MLALARSNHQSAGKPLRVARWCRVSTEEQSKEGTAGIQRQYDQTNRVISTRGYELVASFEVIAVSGTSVALAPEFQELLRLVRTGAIQAVIVSEVSRLMRVDSWESMAVLDIFAKHQCLIVTDGFEIDLSNPEGFLSGGIQTLFAGHERMKLVQKIMSAKVALRRQGRLTEGAHTLPRGVDYDWDANRYIYTEEIWKIQEAYRIIDEEGVHNLAEVARRIGFNRTGLRWTLENPIYIGIRRHDKKRDMSIKHVGKDGRKSWRPRLKCEPHEIIEVKVIEDPAVSPERWHRVQKVLTSLRTNWVARLSPEKHVHLCTGHGRCGCCGGVLYTSGNGKRHYKTGERLTWYCCRSQHPGRKHGLPRCGNSWVAQSKLDALIASFTTKVLIDPKTLTRLIEGSLKLSAEVIRPFPQRGTEDAIAKLERQEKRLMQMCKEEAISIQEFKAEQKPIREEIARLRALAARTKPEQGALTVEELARLVIKGALRFQRLTDRAEQKAILEQLFAEVFFRDESITAFRFHPALVASMGENGKDLAQTITLDQPFRTTPEIPKDHKQCSKCGVILPAKEFPKAVSRCRPCYRESRRARDRGYWQKRKAGRRN